MCHWKREVMSIILNKSWISLMEVAVLKVLQKSLFIHSWVVHHQVL